MFQALVRFVLLTVFLPTIINSKERPQVDSIPSNAVPIKPFTFDNIIVSNAVRGGSLFIRDNARVGGDLTVEGTIQAAKY